MDEDKMEEKINNALVKFTKSDYYYFTVIFLLCLLLLYASFEIGKIESKWINYTQAIIKKCPNLQDISYTDLTNQIVPNLVVYNVSNND